MKALLAAALLALVGGCAAPSRLEFAPEPPDAHRLTLTYRASDWSDGELLLIAEAVDSWQAFAPGRLTLEEVESEPTIVPGTVERPAIARWRGSIGAVVVDRANMWRPRELSYVLRHEFGHALGLDHVGAGVMQATIQADMQAPWSADDLAECQRARVCLN